MSSSVTNRDLPAKPEAFAQAYVLCFNRAEAARRAGYSERRAKQAGHELYTNPAVKARIDELLAELAEDTRLQKHLFIGKLAAVALSSIEHYQLVPSDQPNAGEVRAKADSPPGAMAAVKKLKRKQWINSRGSLVTQTEFELHEAGPSVIAGLKILGVLTEKLEVKDERAFAEQLRAARERVANGKKE